MIDVVVALLLQSSDPVNDEAVNVELPQLFVTFTVGAAGTVFTVNVAAFELAVPAVFVQTARYCLLLSPIATVNDNVDAVAPVIFVHVVPLPDCHCTVGAGLPLADEVKLTLAPSHFVCEDGLVDINGGVSAATALLLISKTEVLADCVDGRLIPSV